MPYECRIAVFGLDREEREAIEQNLPIKACTVVETDCVTDLIAIDWMAILLKTDAIAEDDLQMLLAFYLEVGDFSETVVLIGKADVPPALKHKIKVYPDFTALHDTIKYVLLSAYRRRKKSENFSAAIARALHVLAAIRKKPGISTGELAERLEASPRTVQRCIETLRVAGEWIEYDPASKGWKLGMGSSILLGEF